MSAIYCPPTAWIKKRVAIFIALLLFFAGYFYYDGTYGYKQKNYHYYLFDNFQKIQKKFLQLVKEDNLAVSSATSWQNYASKRVFTLPENAEKILPEHQQKPLPWPKIIADSYQLLQQENYYKIWLHYSHQNNLPSNVGDHYYDEKALSTQINWGIGCLVIIAISSIFFYRILRRKVYLKEGVLHYGKQSVALQSINKIDDSRWQQKGVCYYYYQDNNQQAKKIKFDGFLYGGFEKNNPTNAEYLYQYINKNLPVKVINQK